MLCSVKHHRGKAINSTIDIASARRHGEKFGHDTYDGSRSSLRAVELFAGVGGFRLGLEAAGWTVVWSNQWEPSTKIQHASHTYVRHFGSDGHSNEDISKVLDGVEQGERELPDHDLVVGGFPCQDYSVARTLNSASGLEGKRGVLWWQIHRLLRLKRPRYLLLENVDRLLKSPAQQRGRDFAVMLGSLAELGYTVEWRVTNAADYGYPQRRRRVFIVGEHNARYISDPTTMVRTDGVLAQGLPVGAIGHEMELVQLNRSLEGISSEFGIGARVSQFKNAGVMQAWRVWTGHADPQYLPAGAVLGDVLLDERDVPEEFYVGDSELKKWRYLKGAKSEPKKNKSGFVYNWSEGAIAFPDHLDMPSRTILTAEGGSSPSRFKHVIQQNGRFRRLTPIELERLNGFPDDWTDGHPNGRRAFLMGNALVVGIVERIAKALAKQDVGSQYKGSRLLEQSAPYG